MLGRLPATPVTTSTVITVILYLVNIDHRPDNIAFPLPLLTNLHNAERNCSCRPHVFGATSKCPDGVEADDCL